MENYSTRMFLAVRLDVVVLVVITTLHREAGI